MMKSLGWNTLIAATGLICWATTASAQEVTLIFATTNPSNAHLNVQVLHPWAQRINETGKGVIKIDVRDGPTLANHVNFYDRVTTDVVQIAWGLQNAIGGKFPLSEVAGLPFIADNAEEAAIAFWRLYKSGAMDAEYNDVVPLMLVSIAQSGVQLAKPPKSLDDLRGLKIITLTQLQSQLALRLGATPISLPITDMYEAIQRGTVDGAMVGWTAFQPFKLAEVTRTHVDTALGTSTGMVFMSKKKYEALPAAAKKILDANAGEAQSRIFGAFWDRVAAETRNQIKALDKHAVAALTPEQARQWQQKIAPVIEEWAKSRAGGEKVLEMYRALLVKVKAGG